jgi:hypothetical protein
MLEGEKNPKLSWCSFSVLLTYEANARPVLQLKRTLNSVPEGHSLPVDVKISQGVFRGGSGHPQPQVKGSKLWPGCCHCENLLGFLTDLSIVFSQRRPE